MQGAVRAASTPDTLRAGLFNKLMNEFGEPELLDDILDHWSSSAHCKEKEVLLGKLRDFARARGCRITLLSGDVHQAVYCFTSSTPTYTNLVQDPGFMPQARPVSIPFLFRADQHIQVVPRQSLPCPLRAWCTIGAIPHGVFLQDACDARARATLCNSRITGSTLARACSSSRPRSATTRRPTP